MYNFPPMYDEPLPPLEPRQKKFCDEYLTDFNATAAAGRAGYSVKNAANTGCRILALPQAKAYIRAAMDELAERCAMRTRLMHEEMIDTNFANLGEIFDEHGDIKNLSEIPEYMRKVVQVTTTRVKGARGIKTITNYNLLNRIQLMEKLTSQADRLNGR